MTFRTRLFPATLCVLLTAGLALPQDSGQEPAQDTAQDPPSRVARLNWLQGNVSFQPAGLDTWTGATINYPLTSGDHIYTDVASRAEIHVGPNALRLNGESNLGFLNLDDRTVQVRFTEGALEIRLRRLDDDEIYEIDTPQGAITLLRTGDYRIDTDPARNASMVTVWSGEAEISANGRSFIVHARQTAYIPDGFDPDIRAANAPDDFDAFTRDRNLHQDRLPPPIHVSQSMEGYEDLDQYGSWSDNPDYGWVWAPRTVATDWAPYQQGRWAWVEPWGWTWIDEAPWGFAPFHYGRWAYARNGWVWAPGAVVARPVYAPALVVFVGGPRFTLSLALGGNGAIGWFPLGPREPFYPAYRVSNTYVRQVNITHVTNININNGNVPNGRYANQRVPGAVMAMPQQGFVNARRVHEFGQRVAPQQLADGQIIGAAPPIAPRRESLLGVQTNRTVAAPSQAVMSRGVVVRSDAARSATPLPPVSFEARRPMLDQNQGRPLAQDQLNQLRRQPGAVVNRPQDRPATTERQPAIQPVYRQPESVVRPADRPVVDRPLERLDTRPQMVRPAVPNPVTPAAVAPAPPQRQETAPRQPEFTRPREEIRQATPPPNVVAPPQRQETTRQPEFVRPRQEDRPAPPPQRQEAPRQPEFVRPRQEAPPPPPVRQPEPMRQPEPRPVPEIRRESAPVVREPRAEPAPHREDRPAPVREQRNEARPAEKAAEKPADKKDK